MIIYLAGGMKDGWQEKVSPLLIGHELLDPRSWSDPDPAVYTARDLEGIHRADCLLVHMSSSNPSGFGLSVELGYAYALKKPIIFVDEIRTDWRTGYFGMHRQMATRVFLSLEEAAAQVEFVCDLQKQKNCVCGRKTCTYDPDFGCGAVAEQVKAAHHV